MRCRATWVTALSTLLWAQVRSHACVTVVFSRLTYFPIQVESKPFPLGTSVNPRAVHKRDVTGLACGLWATADNVDTAQNSANLNQKGGLAVPVAANGCNRVACYDTSGMYVCNDQDADITVPMNASI